MRIAIRDAPFAFWGGGVEFLLLANFFFTSEVIFLGDQRSTIFFLFRRRNYLLYAFPIMYVTIWCFFWSTYFSSISTTNFFFLPTFSTNCFCGDKIFISIFSRLPPPPPDIKWCVPNLYCTQGLPQGSLKNKSVSGGSFIKGKSVKEELMHCSENIPYIHFIISSDEFKIGPD